MRCYLITRAALEQFGLSQIPDAWFNWSYVYTPFGSGNPVTLRHVEVVESSQSPRVKEWHMQVAPLGLWSTLIHAIDEDTVNPPCIATDISGNGVMLSVETTTSRDIMSDLSQPDFLYLCMWMEYCSEVLVNSNHYYMVSPNFSLCWANELKRLITYGDNLTLFIKQQDEIWEGVINQKSPEGLQRVTADEINRERKDWLDRLFDRDGVIEAQLKRVVLAS